MSRSDEYEVSHVHRQCCHQGCQNVIMNFAYKKGENPETVPVWCVEHQEDAWVDAPAWWKTYHWHARRRADR